MKSYVFHSPFFVPSAPAAWDALAPSAFIWDLLLATWAQCPLLRKRLGPTSPEGHLLKLFLGLSLLSRSFTQQTAVEHSVALSSEAQISG